MKEHKTDVFLAILLAVSTLACIIAWNAEILVLFYITAVPFFCGQLLLCRMTSRNWLRLLPALPVATLAGMALFYLVRDSGWDRLGALIFGLAAIAPAVGIALGWCVWWICRVRHKRRQHEGA